MPILTLNSMRRAQHGNQAGRVDTHGAKLVVVYECRAIDSDIVPPEVFAGMVLVSLATSILAPVVLRQTLKPQTGSPKG